MATPDGQIEKNPGGGLTWQKWWEQKDLVNAQLIEAIQ
jgi:hypothetical protein